MNKKRGKGFRIIQMVGLFLVMLVFPTTVALATTVNPGTTTNFAILAGSTITNAGSTVISGTGGDIGLYPGTSFVNSVGVTTSGDTYLTDSVASVAKDDLVTIYTQMSNITPVTTIPSQLGGQTLTPGIYNSANGAFLITGTLILDAQGDPNATFIFKMKSTLTTASASTISLINDTQYCQVFWQVGSSATLGTDSNFSGRIYALQSITATTGATIYGQLLARNGAVTLDTNTITNTNCASTVTIAGGQLPTTSTNLYQTLLIGVSLVVVGVSVVVFSRRYAKAKINK